MERHQQFTVEPVVVVEPESVGQMDLTAATAAVQAAGAEAAAAR
jgi:hypothetical protein